MWNGGCGCRSWPADIDGKTTESAGVLAAINSNLLLLTAAVSAAAATVAAANSALSRALNVYCKQTQQTFVTHTTAETK
jgi:ABC-type phosphate transport system substrate-binding protein